MTNEHEVLISLQNVSLSYPLKAGFLKWTKYTPLDDISFDLYRGETLGIIGRNGAGKSSLLRMIAGIVEPDAGRIINYSARVSLLSHGVGFMPHLSGRENAILSGMLLGLRRKEIEQKMDTIIEFSEMEYFIDQPLHTYSSGMRVRLGFSVAIQVDLDVLLIDEAISVGDEDFRKKSSAFINDRVKANETTVLVTHNAQLTRALCTRAIWIENGHVRMSGVPLEVVNAYLGK